jgi:ABC-type taurine transport system ATPase subunit
MKFKVLAELEENPSASNITNATAVAVSIDTGPVTVTVDNSGSTDTRTINLAAGLHKIAKKPAEVITCTGCKVTKIAITD